MIEASLRKTYERICVDPVLPLLKKVHPNHCTLLALFTGVLTLPLLILDLPYAALGAMIFSGYLDTLDGSLARSSNQSSERGAALDIISDRIVESALIIGLFLVDPATRGLPCLLMCASVLICVTSFLIVGLFTQNASAKSFHYSPGIMERAEAFLFFGAMIALPSFFAPLAYLFAFLVLLTAVIRKIQFFKS